MVAGSDVGNVVFLSYMSSTVPKPINKAQVCNVWFRAVKKKPFP